MRLLRKETESSFCVSEPMNSSSEKRITRKLTEDKPPMAVPITSKDVGGKPLSQREDSYVPEPIITQSQVLCLGFALFFFALCWPPLVLLVAYVASILIPYSFRTNDEASRRRQLWRQFEIEDKVSAKLREIPDDVNLAQSYWTNERGMALYTAVMTPKNQEVKAVVCYCHGYTDDITHAKRKELIRLVKVGIAVVMIDYEGHGRSDGTLGLIMDWEKLIDDVSQYFQEVSKTLFAGKNIFLMGESMGGAVAYCVYNRTPKVFSGIVFHCPMCKIADDMLPPQWLIDLLLKVVGPAGTPSIIGVLPLSPAKGDLKQLAYQDSEKRALMTRCPTTFGREPRLATARELLATTTKISNSLSEFDAPFLIQHGQDDKVTDPELSRALYKESKSPDKSIRLYEGLWHSLVSGEADKDVEMVMNDSINWILERA